MKEQFTCNGHEYKKGDKVILTKAFDDADIGKIYTIIGMIEPSDGNYHKLRFVKVKEGNKQTRYILALEEFEHYVDLES